jgi:hypothetical protein
MYTYIFYSIILLSLYFFRLEISNGYKATMNQINKLKMLGSAIQSFDNKKSTFKIILSSIKIISQVIWLTVIQRFVYKNVKKIDKNKYELFFAIEGKIYRVVVNHKRGPSHILQIIDANDNDITNKLEPYFNTSMNIIDEFTPNYFGYDTLTIETVCGTEHTFKENEIIKIKNS